MAELADAQASGACGSNIVRVQVPLPALFFCLCTGYLFSAIVKRSLHSHFSVNTATFSFISSYNCSIPSQFSFIFQAQMLHMGESSSVL